MKKLKFYNPDPIDELAHLENEGKMSTDSSALEIFTDFHKQTPLVIESTFSVSQAEMIMKRSNGRLKMVVDKNNHFLGVVSEEHLNEQEVIKRISQGFSRSELKVSDFMRSRESLKAFSYSELINVTIQDVIDAMESSGQKYCLVVDRESHEIRGIISAIDIARKLRLPIDIGRESSFAEISRTISHHLYPENKQIEIC